MNIFVLDPDPAKCVREYCDSHVNKMLLETTQLLCSAHHAAGCSFPGIYKPSHMNHPSAKWVRRSHAAYLWALCLLYSLHQEYESRRGREHGCKAILGNLVGAPLAPKIPEEEESFVFVGPDDCAPGLPVVERYRELYRRKRQSFKRPMRWTGRPVPSWL